LDTKLVVRSLLEDVASCLRERLNVRSIVVFGSVARGEQRQRSDVDLIVVSDAFPESYSARLEMLTPAFREVKSRDSYRRLRQDGYHLSFSAVPYKPEELAETPPLLLDVTEDGLILYDDGLMRNKLAEVKARMQALGSRRVRTKRGKWYWILKPDLKPGEVIKI
jgi:predicted nucleotidyltransferase